MEEIISILADVQQRREAFVEQLADVDGTIMNAIADHDDVLSDRNIDAIARTCILASKLFSLANDMSLGLPVDGPEAQRRVREALVGVARQSGREARDNLDENPCRGGGDDRGIGCHAQEGLSV